MLLFLSLKHTLTINDQYMYKQSEHIEALNESVYQYSVRVIDPDHGVGVGKTCGMIQIIDNFKH